MDPLLCASSDKASLEGRNGLEQLATIEQYLGYGMTQIRESHVLELQKIAVEDIYPCGGSYRDARFRVSISGSAHVLPEAARVPSLVRDALSVINTSEQLSSLDRAAYALWRFNWIHPFRGGNGRTSRALAYMIICIDAGRMMPGSKTMPSLIYVYREEYVRALQAVDAAEQTAPGDLANIRPMTEFLRRMLMMQMASAIDELSAKGAKQRSKTTA